MSAREDTLAETTAMPRTKSAATEERRTGFTPRVALLALVPLLLLVGVLAVILATDGGLGERTAPPIETLTVQRVQLPEQGMIEVSVINDGPDPINIAQVQVDDAYWQFEMSPAGELDRLESATISIPYPWVQDEAHAIRILSSNGTAFDSEIAVAMESPQADSENVLRYGLVGLYVGIVPIALGLLWYPFLGRLGRRGMNFVLALTVGLLVFLVVDMFQEAQEIAASVASAWNASVLVPVLAILTAALLAVVGRSLRGRDGKRGPLALSYQMATGIGLHNLGEGLAIGAAFALGEAALGVFLIVGFTLHNVTEGVGIAAPIVGHRPAFKHFIGLAALAGGPAILGTWIGAFTYSAFWTTVFLAVGVGAILQVIIEVGRLVSKSQARHEEPAITWTTFGGVAAGVALMYFTAILVTA
jgi:zinc transporter, ZIP family